MMAKIVKTTSKGQITLPKSWRDKFQTDNYLLQAKVNCLTVIPIRVEELEADEEVLFDADRDNHGKGVSPAKMIRLLKKIRDEQN